MKDLISVIIPIYNVEKYLGECLDSVCQQIYKNIEILLIDNGSTDGTMAIAHQYAEADDRIHIYYSKEVGVSAARNIGLKKAKGNYISFVDSDDVVTDSFIQKMYDLICLYNTDIVQCDFVRGIESTQLKKFYKNEKYPRIRHLTGRKMELLLFDTTNEMNAVVLWNKLYRRELFDGIIFPVGRVHEDDAVIYKIYHRVSDIILIDSKEYFYRIRQGSIVTTIENKKIFDIRDNYKEKLLFYEQIHDRELYDLTLKRYCHKIKDCILSNYRKQDRIELNICKKRVLCSKYLNIREKLGILFL